MANTLKKIKKKQQSGELVKHRFPLSYKPRAVQFTVHINNLIGQNKNLIKDIKEVLQKGKVESFTYFRIKELIDYYGMEYCREWFSEVYGWEFKKAV